MRGRRPVSLLLVASLAAMPAFAQSKGERLDSLEARMDGVERQLANQALVDMSRQLEALSGQVRQLRGDIDELQHSLDQARQQQRDQYVDLDTRLRAAEAALTAAQATAAGGVAGSPEAEYQAAFNLLKDGKYDEASAALRDFLAKNPRHELAPNATYWLGEAHYVRRDYTEALAAFEGLLKDYPGNRKTPDALLKVGYCQAELKRPAAARTALTRVIEEFPDSQAAGEAKARLERLGAAGG
jgi:tol-pal system protein YbgF